MGTRGRSVNIAGDDNDEGDRSCEHCNALAMHCQAWAPICKAASDSGQYSFYYFQRDKEKSDSHCGRVALLAGLHLLGRRGPQGKGEIWAPRAQLLGHYLSWVSQASQSLAPAGEPHWKWSPGLRWTRPFGAQVKKLFSLVSQRWKGRQVHSAKDKCTLLLLEKKLALASRAVEAAIFQT